jgi:pyruvate/2-oxoglutarate/acetoin dehydrogenase E1 component
MGYAGQHSQSIETMVTMFPGLKVVAPATGYDAKGLMVAAIREDNPVVFLGHQNLYKNIGCNSAGFVPVPEDLYTVPIGEANVVRKVDNPEDGKAVTIVSYSWMLYSAMDAASKLEDEGYQPEVIDLRTLLPIDIDTIARSVLKTGRLVIAQQAVIEGGLGEQIVGRLMSEQTTAAIAGPPRKSALSSLKAPVEIVGAPFCIPPAAMKLEKSRTVDGERIRGFIPGDVEIVEAAKKTLA